MKKSCLMLMPCLLLACAIMAQGDDWDLGVYYNAYVANSVTGTVHKNRAVSAEVSYTNSVGTTLYREAHTGSTNALGNFGFQIGKGTPLEGSLSAVIFKQVFSINYTITVDVDGSPEQITGSKPVGAAARANAAACALMADDAKRLGGANWNNDNYSVGRVFCPEDDEQFQLLNLRETTERGGERFFGSTPMTDLVRKKTTTEVNSGLQRDYFSVGSGLGLPMWCGPDPDEIATMHGIRATTLGNLNHLVQLEIDNYNADHNTYALYASNLNPAGTGIRSYGSLGSYASGINGAVGLSVSSFTGYGMYAGVTEAPATGEMKFAMVASGGGFDMSYALYADGWVYMSQNPVIGSDARLKREVRSESGTLSRIKQLRPATYFYLRDSGFNHSETLQHGFIAQELETVFPELVTDLPHPTTLDPEKLPDSEIISYKAVNYNGLISILTAGLQELDTKVAAQEVEIEALKQTIGELSTRLDALEK